MKNGSRSTEQINRNLHEREGQGGMDATGQSKSKDNNHYIGRF